MQNNKVPENDKNSKTESLTSQKEIKTSHETLKLRLNNKNIFLVNKAKLLEKSHYFRAITKHCFADHKSVFTEVNIPVSIESFNKVLNYITNDTIDISSNTIFEISKLVDYLQIEGLNKTMFLDHFVFSLNSKTLDHQLFLMEKYPLFCQEFKEIAMKFKESGRYSFSGLYLTEYSGDDHYFKFRADDGYVQEIAYVKNASKSISLLYVEKSIIIHLKGERPLVQQYNLINGDLTTVEIELKSGSTVCSDDKHLFVTSAVEDEKSVKLTLTTLLKKDDYQIFKFSQSKTFDLPRSVRLSPQFFRFLRETTCYMFFSICEEGKIYLFFRSSFQRKPNKRLSAIKIFTICIKTMTLVNCQKLTHILRDDSIFRRLKITGRIENYYCFEKLFFIKKAQKLFIKIKFDDNLFLVFDVKNQYCYFVENPIPEIKTPYFPTSTYAGVLLSRYTVDKDDFVYRYRYDTTKVLEIRRFVYTNNTFVDAGLKHEFIVDKANCRHVSSICYV